MPGECFLTKSWQYQHVYRHGRRIRAHGFTLIYASNSLSKNRLGISVSGMKLAVRRNRVKRLIREFYRLHPLFPPSIAGGKGLQADGIDLVITTNSSFFPKGLADLEARFSPFCQFNLDQSPSLI